VAADAGGNVQVELLYFDGCPSHERLRPVLNTLVAANGIRLEELRIESAEQAERDRFVGSPTVRINGVDVEPGAQERTDFGMKCRLYRGPGGQSGLPPREWIERALREATAS
jgi:hypothetical protein